ncbi:MAG: hypothetical protein ACP6IQ_04990 [Candidatus Njordarchaeia archaeon]
MIRDVTLIQEALRKLIRVVMPPHPIDIGKFSTRSLDVILRDLREELQLDFDEIIVHPGPQPRDSADIELFKQGRIIGKINVKTAVSGDLKATLRKLTDSIRTGEMGAIILFALCYRDEEHVDTKMIIVLLPEDVFKYYKLPDVYEVLQEKIRNKAKTENYIRIEFLAVNDAIELIRAKEAILARDMAEAAYNAVKEAKEMANKAYNAAKEAKEESKKTKEALNKLENKVDRILDLLSKKE